MVGMKLKYVTLCYFVCCKFLKVLGEKVELISGIICKWCDVIGVDIMSGMVV